MFCVQGKLVYSLFIFVIISLSFCRFVDKYTELKNQSESDDAALFEETGSALLTDGIILRRRGARPVRVLHKEKTFISLTFLQYFFNSRITLWQIILLSVNEV